MKISFSTLGCPDWTLSQALDIGVRAGYNGVELRFLEGEASLWKLPSFQATGLQETRATIADSGLVVCCLDTSCRFDSPQKSERERWIDEGVRMAELAAELDSPGNSGFWRQNRFRIHTRRHGGLAGRFPQHAPRKHQAVRRERLA